MNLDQFRKLFMALKTIPSVTGSASYLIERVGFNEIRLLRKNTGNVETVLLKELFKVYQNLDFVNTTILRDHITGRVYSPAFALLIVAGLYNRLGHRLQTPETQPTDTADSIIPQSENIPESSVQIIKHLKPESDEGRFFRLLAQIIGHEYLQSKSIGKAIDTDWVVLPADFRKFTFSNIRIPSMLQTLLKDLDSDFKFGDNNLTSYIDGLIFDHPDAGTRIIEFDEEQHYTPPRYYTLLNLKETIDCPYFSEYIQICLDMAYQNSEVIPKHRLKLRLTAMPPNITVFREWLSQQANVSGYIEAKNGFPYLGGRISQRALYDTLRDVAHLAKENSHLSPPIRFAKKSFENEFHCQFKNISDSQLSDSIKRRLALSYKMINFLNKSVDQ